MININVGKLRNLLERRKVIIGVVKTMITSDEFLVISGKDRYYLLTGKTESEVHSLHLLGQGLAALATEARKQNPAVNLQEYLVQPQSVAVAMLNRDLGEN